MPPAVACQLWWASWGHGAIGLWPQVPISAHCGPMLQPSPQACCGKSPGNFQETAKAAAGRTPKLENGLLRTAPINPGAKTTYRKVPSDLGHLAPLWCNWAWKWFAGGFLETSRKLKLGRQPAACQNFRMGHCGLHQSIRGGKVPAGGCPPIGTCCLAPNCGATRPTSLTSV